MPDCLFCKIIKREIPASVVYEDDRLLAFNDINPQASTHVLVVPKRHIASLNELSADDDQIVGEVVRRAAAIANHLHLIGGRSLSWPPG
ncbi:MAG: histidine triad nucleotide-binding protein [Acidobacteria bacterium]|nr:MAG: histidine triad nucleotide-binding protein [Acidobacteriota bacterium]